MSQPSPPSYPPPSPPAPEKTAPSWHTTLIAVLRSLLALWFLLLGWLSAFLGMLSDACGEPCPRFERQILIGMGVAIVLLVALFVVGVRIERRIPNLLGKIGLLLALAIAGPIVPLLVGGVLSGLAP